MKEGMKVWVVALFACCCMACSHRSGQPEAKKESVPQADSNVVREKAVPDTAHANAVPAAKVEKEEVIDGMYAGLCKLPSQYGGEDIDTVYHYQTGKKIRIGRHAGRDLYLKLGEFYDELTYDGAEIYWGDSLIYATDLEVENDWQTCHVCTVPQTEVTYVLLMINDRPNPNYWHILYMNGERMHLFDHVLAANDYMEGSRYFHDALLYGDVDGDGWVEVGGKQWKECWSDSMSYHPCRIYQLGEKLQLDTLVSIEETRKAYDGAFMGFEDKAVYNPNEAQHEDAIGAGW